MIDWTQICASIAAATDSQFDLAGMQPLDGGDSNRVWQLAGRDGRNFLAKVNAASRIDMFAAEQAGLDAMAATHTIRVPQAVTLGQEGAHSFLVLEFLNLAQRGNGRQLGQQLAAMHRCHADRFGWIRDNTIGVTPQHNSWNESWLTFWRDQRLAFQLELAAHNGYGGKLQSLGKSVLDALPELLANHRPAPSLLHGDLWSGNHAYLRDGTPVIFDPATYFGDREADLAMTEMFGGYDAQFYAAYQAAWPLAPGYSRRKTLYNLYHILNHANLFGGGYAQQAERMMQQLLTDAE